MNWFRKNFLLFALASLTLGLMPFGDSHLMGKLRWLTGGGAFSGEHPMALMDWLDLLMHGLPWVLLIIGIFAFILKWLKPTSPNKN